MGKFQLNSSSLAKALLAILGSFLAWQGNQTIARIDALERSVRALECNQVRILTLLDATPCAIDTLEIGVKTPFSDHAAGNQGNHRNQTREIPLDEPMVL